MYIFNNEGCDLGKARIQQIYWIFLISLLGYHILSDNTGSSIGHCFTGVFDSLHYYGVLSYKVQQL